MKKLTRGNMADVLARLAPGKLVYIPGVSGESIAFVEALRAAPESCRGVTFVSVQFPGINSTDYLGIDAGVRQRAYFMQQHLREGLASGRVDLLPLDYIGIARDLERLPVDIAIAHVSEPDATGAMSLGVSHDFLPLVWKNARTRIALVNPAMPHTAGSFALQTLDCDLICEQASPLITLESQAPSNELALLARNVASLVRDGDTLQLGIGKVQTGILDSLHNHKRLRLHSGMVSSEVEALIDCGAINGAGAIVTGVALGTEHFYARTGSDLTFRFASVRETHDVCSIAAIPSFVAINSAVEVDLFGQINCDTLNGRMLAGVGGMPAFVNGAQLAKNGRSIFCLSATASGGKFSRIVAKLGEGSMTALPRHALEIVVTEYGIADLCGLDIHQRALRLIGIAAPEFRDDLHQQWKRLGSRL